MLPSDALLEVFYNPKKNIDSSILELCETNHISVNQCANKSEIINLLCCKNFDVFFAALPYSYGNLVIPPSTKFVYTIHGLRALEYPVDRYELKYKKITLKSLAKYFFSTYFFSLWKAKKIKRNINKYNKLLTLTKNQAIITDSNHSKYSINYFFPGIDTTKLHVFYPPLKKTDLYNINSTEILDSFSLEKDKYILLVSGDRSEKGAYRACRVLYNLIKNKIRIPQNINILVIGVSHKAPYLRLTHNNRRFNFCGYISAEKLETLYKNAHLFLFPTLNEGFGYPPLEAMKYGTLCACSANSSITEVYGDSVLYFNPHDETEMSIRILQSFDNEIRKEKYEKMILRYQSITQKQEQDLNSLIKIILTNQ
jgi:glycosyltransferase involved in cell wall biosynthesis